MASKCGRFLMVCLHQDILLWYVIVGDVAQWIRDSVNVLISRIHTVHTMEPILCQFLVNPSMSAHVEQYVFDEALVSEETFATRQPCETA